MSATSTVEHTPITMAGILDLMQQYPDIPVYFCPGMQMDKNIRHVCYQNLTTFKQKEAYMRAEFGLNEVTAIVVEFTEQAVKDAYRKPGANGGLLRLIDYKGFPGFVLFGLSQHMYEVEKHIHDLGVAKTGTLHLASIYNHEVDGRQWLNYAKIAKCQTSTELGSLKAVLNSTVVLDHASFSTPEEPVTHEVLTGFTLNQYNTHGFANKGSQVNSVAGRGSYTELVLFSSKRLGRMPFRESTAMFGFENGKIAGPFVVEQTQHEDADGAELDTALITVLRDLAESSAVQVRITKSEEQKDKERPVDRALGVLEQFQGVWKNTELRWVLDFKYPGKIETKYSAE